MKKVSELKWENGTQFMGKDPCKISNTKIGEKIDLSESGLPLVGVVTTHWFHGNISIQCDQISSSFSLNPNEEGGYEPVELDPEMFFHQ